MRRPGMPWLFAAWLGVSAAAAVGGGLVLGILAALQVGIGSERWTQAVQAHGRLQLWAFAGVFIVTLSYEFLARMNARPAFPVWLRVAVPGALALGAMLQAAGQLRAETFGLLGSIGGAVLVAAAATYLISVVRVRPPQPLRLDPQPWFTWLGASWLLAASLFALVTAARWESGASLPVETHVISEMFLRGFVLQMILAIAPRAFRGHLGVPVFDARKQIALLLIVNLGMVAWVAGQDVWVLPGIEALARGADLALGIGLLLTTYWLRIFAGMRARFRATERYEWAIPLAWLGVAAWAIGLLVLALAPGDAGLYREGAVRHIFLLGFMVPLMLAMAHVVLSRFGTGTIPWENLLTAGFILSLVAWPLRVGPALISDAPGDVGRGLMGLAGILMVMSLGLAMLVFFQTAARVRQPIQRFLHSIPG